jgi:hypothetical protein
VAGASISISGNTISFDGTLYFTAAQIAVLFTAYSSTIQAAALLNTKIASTTAIQFLGCPFTRIASSGNGTLINTWNHAHQFAAFAFTNSAAKTLRCAVADSVENLMWGNDIIAPQPWTTTQLATKQASLNFIAENAHTDNNHVQTNEAANNFLAWMAGTYSNVAGSHQILTMGTLYENFSGTGTTAPIYFSAEFKAGTCSEILMSINDSTGWTGFQEVKYTGLTTSDWLSVSWIIQPYSSGAINLHMGIVPTGSSLTQAAGTVLMRNLHIWRPVGGVAMSKQLAITGNLNVTEAIECIAVHQKSDRNLKEDIVKADAKTIQDVFDNVDVYTYRRNDGPLGSRLGFIAQDMENALKDTGFDNIMGRTRDGLNHRTIDHSRLVAILWGVVKNQQKQIDDLIAKVNA